MTGSQDYTSSKKRIRIFMYEFDGCFSGDPSVLGTNDNIKEEGGLFLILASVLIVASLVLLGIDLALSPILSLNTEVNQQIPPMRDIYRGDNVPPGGRFTFPRSNVEQSSTSREQFDRRSCQATVSGSARMSRRRFNSPISHETSFTANSNLRPREYWL